MRASRLGSMTLRDGTDQAPGYPATSVCDPEPLRPSDPGDTYTNWILTRADTAAFPGVYTRIVT
jgi:hypothetical protein